MSMRVTTHGPEEDAAVFLGTTGPGGNAGAFFMDVEQPGNNA